MLKYIEVAKNKMKDIDSNIAKEKIKNLDFSKAKEKVQKIDLSKVKDLVNKKSTELKEVLDLVVEDPSLNTDTKVNLIINATSLICAIVATQPLPFADILILSPIQVVMVTYLSKALGMSTDNTKANEMLVYLLGTLGWGTLSQQVVIGLYKTVLPYAGGFTTIPLVYASTFGLGMACKTLIKAKMNNIEISKEQLNKIKQEAMGKIKSENRDWSLNSLKLQIEAVIRSEFREYKEKLNSYDNKIDDMKKFSSMDFNKKKNLIEERLNIYKNIVVNDKVLHIITFMDSKKSINYIENTIAKLNRNEIKLDISFDRGRYFIEELCELSILIKDNKYIIEDINVFDSSLNYIINLFNSNNEVMHLKDKQIREKLIYAIDNAKYELNISSPWMSNKVIDDEMINRFERCLRRGTSIKIVYGIGDSSSNWNVNNKRDENSDIVAINLKDRFSIYKNNFKIKKSNSHYKLLICDEKFLVEGSYNFLSFVGDYKTDKRGEGATYNTNLNLIRNLRKEYFNF